MNFRLTREAEADVANIYRYSFYYRVTDTGILILRVLHQRMDPARHL